MAAEAFPFQWSGSAMEPMRPKAADKVFVVGKIYWMTEAKSLEPSTKSFRHLWAVLQSAWASLPEDLREAYPDADVLRQKALIERGHYDEIAIEVGDAATAGRLATSLKRMNCWSHVRIQGGHVFQRTAKSMKDMEAEEFQRAKDGVFGVVADLLGVTVDELTKQGE